MCENSRVAKSDSTNAKAAGMAQDQSPGIKAKLLSLGLNAAAQSVGGEEEVGKRCDKAPVPWAFLLR